MFFTERNKKNPQKIKVLLQEKEYDWAFSYQIKNEICFNIYKSAYSDKIAWASYLFNVCLQLRILFSVHLV